jgi:hypothetical protein
MEGIALKDFDLLGVAGREEGTIVPQESSRKKDFDDHHNDPTDEADEVVQQSQIE